MKKIIQTENAPKPIGPYSQGIVSEHRLYTSGQIGIDETGKLADYIKAQTELCLKHIKTIVEAAGSSVDRILKTTVYLTDMNNFSQMNEVYQKFFDEYSPEKYPVRSTLGVSQLPKNALVEIEAIADV